MCLSNGICSSSSQSTKFVPEHLPAALRRPCPLLPANLYTQPANQHPNHVDNTDSQVVPKFQAMPYSSSRFENLLSLILNPMQSRNQEGNTEFPKRPSIPASWKPKATCSFAKAVAASCKLRCWSFFGGLGFQGLGFRGIEGLCYTMAHQD